MMHLGEGTRGLRESRRSVSCTLLVGGNVNELAHRPSPPHRTPFRIYLGPLLNFAVPRSQPLLQIPLLLLQFLFSRGPHGPFLCREVTLRL